MVCEVPGLNLARKLFDASLLSMIKCPKMRIRTALFFGLILAAWLTLFWGYRHNRVLIDERWHAAQVQRFSHGDFSLDPELAMTPGYHVLVAAILYAVRDDSLAMIRLVSLLGSFTGVLIFYRIVSELWPQERWVRTVQFAFFPLFFPFCFLAYTDVWGVVFLLLSVYAALRKQLVGCAVALAVAVVIRPPAILWGALLWVMLAGDLREAKSGWPWVTAVTRRTWALGIVAAAFLIFVVWNGGVAIGPREKMPVSCYPTNVWFFLGLVAVFFPTQCVNAVREVFSRGRRTVLRAFALIVVLWLIFGATFHLAHIFNRINMDYMIHNIVLYQVATQPWAQLVALAILPLGLAGWCLTPLAQERLRWIVPLGLVSVLVIPHIDPRYYLPGFALFLAFRQPLSRGVEWTMAAAYALGAVVLTITSFRVLYFP